MGKKLNDKYKAHVGRLFKLSNRIILKEYNSGSHSWNINCRFSDRIEFSDAVFILDETNVRVCIAKKNGQTCWIPKSYLLSEIVTASSDRKSLLESIQLNCVNLLQLARTEDISKTVLVAVETITRQILTFVDNENDTHKKII